MAPRLPNADSLGGLPSARSGAPIARYDTSAAWDGVASFGAKAAGAANAIDQNWQAMAGVEAETAYQRFKFEEAKRYDEATRTVAPGGAKGFADGYSQGYFERAKAFKHTLPPQVQLEYDQKLFTLEQTLFSDSLDFERGEQRRFALNNVDESVRNVILPKASLAAELPADDPRKAGLLTESEEDAWALIDNNPALTDVQKDQLWNGATDANGNYTPGVKEQIQRAFATSLPPEERVYVDPSQENETVGERIRFVESSGDPNARPIDPATGKARSSALGPDGFLEGTWIGLLRKHRPDLAEGRTDEEIAALRTDPDLSAEMRDIYSRENSETLTGRGFEATPGNVYLAHFLGPNGAVSMLGADQVMSAADINPAAAAANPEVFYRDGDKSQPRSVGEVIAWANAKMDGTRHADWGRRLDALSFENRVTIGMDGSAALVKMEAARKAEEQAAYAAQLNAAKNGVMDGTFNLLDLDTAYSGGNGWLTDATDRAAVKNMIVERDKEGLAFAEAATKLQDGSYTWNPYNADDQKAIDLVYEKGPQRNGVNLLGDGEAAATDAAALQYIVDKTGLIPAGASDVISGAVWSSDPQRQARGFAMLDQFYRSNPQAAERAFDDDTIRRLQDYELLAPLLPPDELQARLDPAMNPEEARRREGLRTEGEKLAREVPTATILDAFDPSSNVMNFAFLSGGDEPVLSPDPGFEQALRRDFETLYAERYSVTGQSTQAQAQAIERLKGKYGASDTGSAPVLMAYPPESILPAIAGSTRWMDDQLGELVEATMPDADRYFVISDENTAGAVERQRNGQIGPVPYQIGVFDQDGVFNILSGPDGGPLYVAFDPVKAAKDADQRIIDNTNRLIADEVAREFGAWGEPKTPAEPNAAPWGAPVAEPGAKPWGLKPSGPTVGGGQ